MSIAPPRRYTRAEAAKARARARASVLKCDECELTGTNVPCAGPTPARFVVIGEAPGLEEATRKAPFVGPAGKLLRAMLSAHFDVDEVGYMNTVSCRPPGNRVPVRDERVACRHNLELQLESFATRYVLLCGATALDAFRSDLKVSEVHGQLFVWRDAYMVMPVYHPAAILRERTLKKPTIDDVEKWARVVLDGDRTFGFRCNVCKARADERDDDAVPYCSVHAQGMRVRVAKERKRWETKRVVQIGLPF